MLNHAVVLLDKVDAEDSSARDACHEKLLP
jgi:hypothetical protein